VSGGRRHRAAVWELRAQWGVLLLWIALVPPTLTVWASSIRWLQFMSIYAIVSTQLTVVNALRAKLAAQRRDD